MAQFFATVLLRFLSLMPWWFLNAFGGGIGLLMYRINGRETKNTRINIAIAYPEMLEKERERLIRSSLISTAKVFVEMPKIWLYPAAAKKRVEGNGAAEEVSRLIAEGNGVILAMPHLGNWEMVSASSTREVNITGLYRRPRQTFIEPIMLKGRSIGVVQMVPASRKGLKTLDLALKHNEVIAILPDQVPKNAGASATVAPFYGRESHTMVLLSRFAAKYNTPVLFIWASRLANGHYRIEHFVADRAIADKDPRKAAIALNQAVQQCVEVSPAQYQWSYRRFQPVDDKQPNPYQ